MSENQPAVVPAEKPKRLTLSEIVVALLARGGEHSSVKLSRNAKGDTQIEVTVRSGDQDVPTVDEASEKAAELYDALRERYPFTGS